MKAVSARLPHCKSIPIPSVISQDVGSFFGSMEISRFSSCICPLVLAPSDDSWLSITGVAVEGLLHIFA